MRVGTVRAARKGLCSYIEKRCCRRVFCALRENQRKCTAVQKASYLRALVTGEKKAPSEKALKSVWREIHTQKSKTWSAHCLQAKEEMTNSYSVGSCLCTSFPLVHHDYVILLQKNITAVLPKV